MSPARTARVLDRSALSDAARTTVESYEQRFGTSFAHLLHFDADTLAYLHGPGELPANVRIADADDPAVAERFATVTAVANLDEQTTADRTAYLKALLDIYGLLPVQAADAAVPEATVLAPEREGRMLAERLGVLPHPEAYAPQAKRMPAEGGLYVGVAAGLPAEGADRVVVVDGVVASGVTLMAMMQLAAKSGAEIEVFTCHSTPEGALALVRYAELLGVQLTLHAGLVSGLLNEKFYTVEPEDRSVLLLGDIGDTIAPVV